jgi:hypothetical protein
MQQALLRLITFAHEHNEITSRRFGLVVIRPVASCKLLWFLSSMARAASFRQRTGGLLLAAYGCLWLLCAAVCCLLPMAAAFRLPPHPVSDTAC